jgi:hypothetical protein
LYAAALDALDKKPQSALVSPSLMGSSGVVTLSIVSVIPDIMQHYHDVIVNAQKEVLIATNAWEPGRSVELVTDAFKILNERAVKDNRTVYLWRGLMVGRCQNLDGRSEYSKCISTTLRKETVHLV